MIPVMEFEVHRQKSFHVFITAIWHTKQFKELVPGPITLTNVFNEVLDS